MDDPHGQLDGSEDAIMVIARLLVEATEDDLSGVDGRQSDDIEPP